MAESGASATAPAAVTLAPPAPTSAPGAARERWDAETEALSEQIAERSAENEALRREFDRVSSASRLAASEAPASDEPRASRQRSSAAARDATPQPEADDQAVDAISDEDLAQLAAAAEEFRDSQPNADATAPAAADGTVIGAARQQSPAPNTVSTTGVAGPSADAWLRLVRRADDRVMAKLP